MRARYALSQEHIIGNMILCFKSFLKVRIFETSNPTICITYYTLDSF